jgi:poly(3-hydroxybutyrate) depolymerase
MFGSTVFYLMSEAESNAAWGAHNGCSSAAPSEQTVAATYKAGNAGTVTTTATLFSQTSCPAQAPVELYAINGAGHGGASSIDGESVISVVMKFFERTEAALL